MALHRAQDRLLPVLNGNVLTSGGSLNLAKGQFGIFNAKSVTKDGLVALDAGAIAGLNATDTIQFRLGNAERPITRSRGNFNESSRDFKVGAITSIETFAPALSKKVDELIIGYDGRDGTEIDLETGDNVKVSITLSGRALGIMGFESNSFTFDTYLTKEDDNQTNQEIVEKAIESLKNSQVHSGVSVTEFVEITPVNSENPAVGSLSGSDHTFYFLDVPDQGDSNALADVQAQYPGYNIIRTDRNGVTSTYGILIPDLGEEEQTPLVPEPYEAPLGVKITGCEGTPGDGWSETPADSGVWIADAAVTYEWTVGETCTAITEEYSVTVPDDECGNTRLDEIKAYYGDDSITSESVGDHCQTTYLKNVTSNIVCEECDKDFRDLFVTEPPADFGLYSWELSTPKSYSSSAKMGIKVKGKETISIPEEFLSDNVPFFNTSVHISASAGVYFDKSLSYESGGNYINIKVLSRAADLSNLGGNLKPLEKRDSTYFNGETGFRSLEDDVQAQFEKSLYGKESILNPNAQYIIYSIAVSHNTRTQGFNKVLSEGFFIDVAVEVGRQGDLETLLAALAAKAGVNFDQAYA